MLDKTSKEKKMEQNVNKLLKSYEKRIYRNDMDRLYQYRKTWQGVR